MAFGVFQPFQAFQPFRTPLGGAPAPAATGGTVTTYNDGTDDWTIHTFTTTANLVVNSEIEVEYLVVAGGGSGRAAAAGGGGGGAGGLFKFVDGEASNTGSAVITLTPDSYTMTIGAGGAAVTTINTDGSQGTNTTAIGLTALGGGRGTSSDGASGGSGSGATGGFTDPPEPVNTGGAGTSPQGNNGGAAFKGAATLNRNGGGGGGAGAVGADAVSGAAGNGGAGKTSSITGTAVGYAGGGGGFSRNGTAGTATDGGSAGAPAGNDTSSANATPNTGGGSGGGVAGTGTAGSGIVIVRYRSAA